jgi:hypothetical protein
MLHPSRLWLFGLCHSHGAAAGDDARSIERRCGIIALIIDAMQSMEEQTVDTVRARQNLGTAL